MIKVGIVGATGYTGSELLRLLVNHPHVEIAAVCSRSDSGSPVTDMFPNLRGFIDLDFCQPDVQHLGSCDLIFFATPHGVAQSMMADILEMGAKVIDLSGDFRLKDLGVWEHWYQQEHQSPELIDRAIYGLPEIHRDQIRGADIIACPGCYPTAVNLALIPLLESGWVQTQGIIADAKSGVSGAGRKANVATLLAESADNFKAYGMTGHRHEPEIAQILSESAGEAVELTFVPHLVPMIRGIEATIYVRLKPEHEAVSAEELQKLFEQRFAEEAFVDVLPQGQLPETRSVKGSNFCRLAVHRKSGTDLLIISSVIDNLVKGASGQAVQCMNIVFGFDEHTGLQHVPLAP